jgi:peptide/nickel transport system permease protein
MVLGLVPFSTSHWGMMLQVAMTNTGALYGSSAMTYFLVPIIGIVLFQMGCLFFASGMEEAFNPRLRTQ